MVKKVYDSFIDEKSKKIYTNRLLNYITGDNRYFLDIIRLNEYEDEQGVTVSEYYDELISKGTKIIVWGAGLAGHIRYDFNKLLGYDGIKFYVDSNPEAQKRGCNEKKVLSPKEFAENWNGEPVIIETINYEIEKEIEEQIKKLLNNKCRIIKHPIRETQYFDEFLNFDDNEVFLDCGCYDCGTVNDFINRVDGKYSRIISFEPDTINFENCKRIVKEKKWNNVEIINKGLWDKSTTLNFVNGWNSASKIVEEEDFDISHIKIENVEIVKVDVVDIDSIVQNERVTFIKMDIEGAELNALKGAEKTIKKNKPKLAICIYHKPEDVTAIPSYLKSIVPEYKFILRHYSDCSQETVLYAVVE